MTLLAADNFAIYGTGSGGRTNMLRNPMWLEVPTTALPSTANPRGSLGTHALRITASAFNGPRCSFFGDQTEVIMRAGVYIDALPGTNTACLLFQPHDSGNSAQCAIGINSTGTIELRRGSWVSGTLIAVSAAPVITAGAYYHIETRIKIGDGDGACEVRVNGVVVLNVSAVDTKETAVAGTAQCRLFTQAQVGGATMDVADFGYSDVSGADNNDFQGDVVYLRRDMIATDSSGWTRNTGASDHAAIDDPTPDDDTTYIQADIPGLEVLFQPQSLPAGVSEVVSFSVLTLHRKTDTGASSLQNSFVSVAASPADETAGAVIAENQTYTYTADNYGVDPFTGVAITPASYPDLRVKYDKTA